MRISNRPAPQNLIDVQYSIPYCLALVSLHGPESLLPVTAEALEHMDVLALASKVKLSLSPEFDAVYPGDILARVVVTSQGERFVSEPTSPAGEPLMTWDQLEAKFKATTRLAMSPAQATFVLEAIAMMKSGDMTPLRDCLSQLKMG